MDIVLQDHDKIRAWTLRNGVILMLIHAGSWSLAAVLAHYCGSPQSESVSDLWIVLFGVWLTVLLSLAMLFVLVTVRHTVVRDDGLVIEGEHVPWSATSKPSARFPFPWISVTIEQGTRDLMLVTTRDVVAEIVARRERWGAPPTHTAYR